MIRAPQDAVWDNIGKAIFSSFPMENVVIPDENNFRALIRVKIGLFRLKLYLRGELGEVSSTESLIVTIGLKSRGSIIQLTQKVLFSLTSVDEDNTEITCQVLQESVTPSFLKIFLGREVSRTAKDTLQGIREYLRQIDKAF